uniref:hypothetical protein n=1 Tax=Acetatifactor sp. TaxID=1872090 RepID=UPI0040569BE2
MQEIYNGGTFYGEFSVLQSYRIFFWKGHREFGLGDGKTGGFVSLSSEDVAEIYRIAAKASI